MGGKIVFRWLHGGVLGLVGLPSPKPLEVMCCPQVMPERLPAKGLPSLKRSGAVTTNVRPVPPMSMRLRGRRPIRLDTAQVRSASRAGVDPVVPRT